MKKKPQKLLVYCLNMISWPYLISHLWFLQVEKRLQRSRRNSKCQILRALLALGCLLLKRVKSMSKGELHIHLFEDTRQMRSETISTYVIGLFEKLAFSIKLWVCRLNAERIDYKIFLKLFSACTTVIFSNILQLISL